MVEIVLTYDRTLGRAFHNQPLLNFLPCAPVKFVPWPVYDYLSAPEYPPDMYGRATLAPYSIRKIEASLKRSGNSAVVVAHPDYVGNFVDEDTKIIGVTTMDPLGLGPLSLMFNNGCRLKSWVQEEFMKLLSEINAIRRRVGRKILLIVGGAGEWEFELRPEMIDRLG